MKHAKVLGMVVGLVAIMALAEASPAAAVEFHTSAPGATLTGEQRQGPERFVVQGSEASCGTTKWTGKFPESKSSPTIEVHPEYSNCKAFGFAEASVSTSGCKEKVYAATSKFDLLGCTEGIVISAGNAFGKCVVDIPNQTGVGNLEISVTEEFLLWLMWLIEHIPFENAKVVTSTGVCPLKAGAAATTLTGGADIFANNKEASLWIE